MSATQNARTSPGTVDAAEVAKFEAMAAEWWDPPASSSRCTC